MYMSSKERNEKTKIKIKYEHLLVNILFTRNNWFVVEYYLSINIYISLN